MFFAGNACQLKITKRLLGRLDLTIEVGLVTMENHAVEIRLQSMNPVSKDQVAIDSSNQIISFSVTRFRFLVSR